LRLQLIAACILLAAPAAAQDEAPSTAGARVDVFNDGAIVVVAPALRTSILTPAGVRVDGGAMVNFVSGATPTMTVDAISAATTFSDVRTALDVSLSHTSIKNVTLGASYMASLESDYTAHGPGVTVGGELLNRMVRLTGGYRLRFDKVSVTSGEPIDESTVAHDVDLRWVQILGRTTRLSVLATGGLSLCSEGLGCDGSPYRYAAVTQDEHVLYGVREKHPDRRIRLAIAGRLSQALGSIAALHIGYRLYLDNWQVHAHTADLTLALALFGERLMVRPQARFTYQGAASFWRPSYDGPTPPQFATGDKELSELWNLMVGGAVEVAFFAVGPLLRLAPTARISHTWYRYPQHDAVPARNAWLVGGGLDAEF
jgi:hypothetical protein